MEAAADRTSHSSSPLDNVTILLDKRRIRHIHMAGCEMRIPPRAYDVTKVSDLALVNWNDLYTQDRMAALQGGASPSLAAQ